MNRHGIVLLSVLWSVALLSSLAAGIVLISRVGFQATRNRMALTQARWALGWCESVAFLTGQEDSTYSGGSASLSNGSWCDVRLYPASARFDINHADSLALRRLLGHDSLAAAVLDWRDPDDSPRAAGCERDCYHQLGLAPPGNRDFDQPAEIRKVRGLGTAPDSLIAILTVYGVGQVNPAYAPAQVLASLPGLSLSLARRIEVEARRGRVTSLAGVAQLATPREREDLERWWTDLLARTSFERGALVLEETAGSSIGPAIAHERAIVRMTDKDVAVLMRESW